MRSRRVTVKVLPTPRALSTSMLPCIISAIFRAMVRPKPVPWMPLKVVFFSRSKGSKMRWRELSLIPIPVSRNMNW